MFCILWSEPIMFGFVCVIFFELGLLCPTLMIKDPLLLDGQLELSDMKEIMDCEWYNEVVLLDYEDND